MRTVIAMSGGVDSSVAALTLKDKGADLVGLTMKTWPKEECGAEGERLCCSLDAIQHARSVAEDLDIPYYVVDLSEVFASTIKSYFASEYEKGRTPNPCIYCNSRIKFGALFRKARGIGAERIATGHYARIIRSGERYLLAEAVDRDRDQSYFLYDIDRDTLRYLDFPLGSMPKDEVRKRAADKGLMTAYRKASQDICFATAKGGYKGYLEAMGVRGFEPGSILDTRGNVIGEHSGIASYTVGQRKGLGLSMPEPVYVIKIDVRENTLTVGTRDQAMKGRIRVAGFNWLSIDGPTPGMKAEVRIRHNGPKVPAEIHPIKRGDECVVEFSAPQFAPTPGQAAVFYDGEIVMGGGWIEEVLE
jgi:tRNA-specific 2-thiouridylase